MSKHLQRQLRALERLADKRLGRRQPNALTDPEWRPLCDVVLSVTEAWPATHARAAAAIAYLEDLGQVPWYAVGKVSARPVLYAALQDNMPARIAIAEALGNLTKQQE